MKYLVYALLSLMILLSAKSDKKQYNEKYRPQYHFSPAKNWLFQSNGFVHYKGEYHLFYHNITVSNKVYKDELGHAVSKDLLHWEHRPFAFTMEEKAASLDASLPPSGSAVIDSMNVAGLQQKGEIPMLLFYSDSKGNQNLAFSNDKGTTWDKYPNNPVISNNGGMERDPKVFFHPPTGKWIMVLFRSQADGTAKSGITIYNSANLREWKFCSQLDGFGESPDLFEIPLEGSSTEKKWVVIGGEGGYKIGSFDGLKFSPETELQKLDFGPHFFAAQTLFNAPNGKIIQLAWMRGGEFSEMPFNGQMNFPTELSLRSSKKGLLLCRKPVDTITSLSDHEIKKKDKLFIPGLKGSLVGGLKGDAVYIRATFLPKTSDSFGFLIRSGKQSTGTDMHYETAKKILDVNGIKILVEPIDGKIELEILVDRSSIEVFANHGESVVSTCFSPVQGEDDLLLFTQGGELYVESLEVYNLKSAWENK